MSEVVEVRVNLSIITRNDYTKEYIIPYTYPYDTSKINTDSIGKFLKTIVNKYHIAPVEEHIKDYLDTIRLLEHDISIQGIFKGRSWY